MVIHHQKKWPIPASILFHWTNCQLLHLRRLSWFNPRLHPTCQLTCSPATPTTTAICCTAQPWVEFLPCTKPHSSARSINFNVQWRWHALSSCPLLMSNLKHIYMIYNIYICIYFFFMFLRFLHFSWSVFFQIHCGHTDSSHVWQCLASSQWADRWARHLYGFAAANLVAVFLVFHRPVHRQLGTYAMNATTSTHITAKPQPTTIDSP